MLSQGALTYEHRSGLTTKLLIAVFFCGIFEGAARKWLLPPGIPELSYLAYLSKFLTFGLISIAAAVSVAPSRSLLEFRGYLQVGLAMLFCGALLSAFSGFSVAGGFLTIVMTVAGPVLAYTAASKIRFANIKLVLQWIAVMSLFPAVLGLIQFELPVTHVLNKYLGETGWRDVIVDLGRVRATGTFSFISGMAAMTVVCIWSGLSLRTLSTRARDQILGLVAIVAGFTCGFAALSRGAIFLGLALLATRLIFVGRDPKLLILIIVGALGYGYLSINRPTTQMELEVTLTSGVFVRHSRSDSVLDRLSSWGRQLAHASDNVPLGNGFGLSQIGGQAVDKGHRVLASYEGELARLVAEIGVFGFRVVSGLAGNGGVAVPGCSAALNCHPEYILCGQYGFQSCRCRFRVADCGHRARLGFERRASCDICIRCSPETAVTGRKVYDLPIAHCDGNPCSRRCLGRAHEDSACRPHLLSRHAVWWAHTRCSRAL
jgi:hypothetical protein